jgi:pimeloyl-ACP methyl ester carboxylesterase
MNSKSRNPLALPPEVPLHAPPRHLWLWELRAVPELVAGLVPRPFQRRPARGTGQPVMLLPGWGTNDKAMLLMMFRLRRLGFRAETWGLGRNHGDLKALVPKAIERALSIAHRTGQKVQLVGWSLGGTIAREVAREHPEAVDRIVTLGSPVVGGPKYTFAAHSYRKKGYDLDRIEQSTAKRDAVPLKVPVTALYDRRDAVVAWPACIDRRNAGVQHMEVHCSHFGMAVDRSVFREVAKALAAR